MSREIEGRGNCRGRPRGGSNRGGRGFGGPGGGRDFHRFGSQGDTEEQLLIVINSEFQVNCTEYRKIADIYEHVKQFPHLHNHIYGSIESLKKFIAAYKDNFLIMPDNETVKWLKERVVSKNDRKENKRRERREYEKFCQQVDYDLVFEENVLSFITALFLATGESWLRLDLLEKAVKQAFYSEADLLDYAGNNIKSFLNKRHHMFLEHMDQIQFFGQNAYNVVYAMNNFIKNSYQGNSRETVRRLHEFYLNEFPDDVRSELKMDERKPFCDFLLRCKFVFDYTENDTHVASKKEIPFLAFQTDRLIKEFAEVVEIFKQVHKKYEKTDDQMPIACDIDDLDEMLGLSNGVRKVNGKKRNGARLAASDQSSSVSVVSDNPFEQRRSAAAAAANTAAGRNIAEPPSSTDVCDSAADVRTPRVLNPFLRTPGMSVAN